MFKDGEDGVISLLFTALVLVFVLMLMSGNADDTELRSPLTTPDVTLVGEP